jgi:hypothetical protein
MGGDYPAGDYTMMWDGDGTVTLSGDASGSYSTSPVKVKVIPTGGGIDLKITRSVQGNHLKNLKFIMPGFGPTDTFHPLFLERLKPYSVIRFMNWGATNSSPQVNWADRTEISNRSWMHSVPWEYMIELCNKLGVDPWFCLPHMASTDYVKQLATMVKATLKPELKVYLEYSNECWNGSFSQTGWLENQSSTETVRQTYARYAVNAFKAWEAAWGDRNRLVRVLAGQAANPDVLRQVMVAAGAGNFDAIASAPYFGHRLGRDPAVANWSDAQVIQACKDDLAEWRLKMDQHKALADQWNVAHIAYEGGQHLAAIDSSNTALVNKLISANRDPGMEEVYDAYLKHWEASGSGVFAHFMDIYRPSKWGSWGIYEYQNQPETPKSKAVVATANRWKTL